MHQHAIVEYNDDDLVGEISESYAAELAAVLPSLRSRLNDDDAEVIATGRNISVAVNLTENLPVLVKCFGTQSFRNDLRDSRRGSKARRSFEAAQHLTANGVGTPAPIAYLERWAGRRLLESYYLSQYHDDATALGDHLLTLYHSVQDVEAFIASLKTVALGTRRMHDAGFVHNDLGNQNILLSDNLSQFNTIDLNRGRIRDDLTENERARDLSRLSLPSGMNESFLALYWGGDAPKSFVKAFQRYRRLFGLHAASRKWRHPFREARKAREEADIPAIQKYPKPEDVWIWDNRTNQAFGALDRKERLKRYPKARYLPMLKDTALAAKAIAREYRQLQQQAFVPGTSLHHKAAVSIEPKADSFEKKLQLLESLPGIPTLVRLYHHTDAADLAFRKQAIQTLQTAGHPVSVSLVQDRRALLEPASWEAFVRDAVAGLEHLDFVEVAHAINRVKWGIWDFDELAQLYEPLISLQTERGDLRFTGPAGIDFEYPFVISALKRWPGSVNLSALSHHLYVDRRGAPENLQSGFDATDKFVLARAIALQSGLTDKLLITGVNWPLENTGPYSPIAPPHRTESDDVGGVSEDTYASFLLRYLMLAAASGHVERVYWWRLVSRGYGLVDDCDEQHWRPRPAFDALKYFHELTDGAVTTRVSRPTSEDRKGLYEFEFQRKDASKVLLAYAHGEPQPLTAEMESASCVDQQGRPISKPSAITGSPLYFHYQ